MMKSSDEEEDQFDRSLSSSVGAIRGATGVNSGNFIIAGEAPESDTDSDGAFEGSTVSLTSSLGSPIATIPGPLDKKFTDLNSAITKTQPSVKSLKDSNPDFYKIYKGHVELNKRLHKKLTKDFLEPVFAQTTKNLEKQSQNLSNSQMEMQEAILQSRLTSLNLVNLQAELIQLNESCKHLRGLKLSNAD